MILCVQSWMVYSACVSVSPLSIYVLSLCKYMFDVELHSVDCELNSDFLSDCLNWITQLLEDFLLILNIISRLTCNFSWRIE